MSNDYISFLDEEDRRIIDMIQLSNNIPLLEHNLVLPHRQGVKASNSIAQALISRAMLITKEMGMGKTFDIMGIFKELIHVLPPEAKLLYCCPNEKILEDSKLFREQLGVEVATTNAGQKGVSIAFREMDRGAKILVFGHSVWDTEHYFHKELIPRLDQYQAFALDEGGMVLKNTDNYAYRSMVEFVPHIKYRYIMNATPIETDLTLLLNQFRVLGIPLPSKNRLMRQYGSVTREGEMVFGNLDHLRERTKYHVFNMSRTDLDDAGDIVYDLDVKLMQVTPIISEICEEDTSRCLRYPFTRPEMFTPDRYPSLHQLISICKRGQQQGEKILVFVRNVEPKAVMKQLLEEQGLSVGIYDGHHTSTQEAKKRVEDRFNRGDFDVLLTNKIYSLSLSTANHVLMYDLPSNYYQYIFRAVRTLETVNLKVTVLLYNANRDFKNLEKELRAEEYQNQFSGRNFDLIKDMFIQAHSKLESREYD